MTSPQTATQINSPQLGEVQVLRESRNASIDREQMVRCECNRLRSALTRLQPYVRHRHECHYPQAPCTCGLDKLMDELR